MSRRAPWSGVLALLLIAACTPASGSDDSSPEATSSTTTVVEDAAPAFVGSISVQPSSGPAGTRVTVTGEGLPEARDLELAWSTASGSWVVQGDLSEEYHGREFATATESMGTFRTDEDGSFTTDFVVPEGFGFAHDVIVMDTSGTVLNKALFDVGMEVSISPTEGPPGTPITIEVKGMGWQTLEDTRTVTYDNDYVGFMSAVTTNGTARAVIPATGHPGPHQIQVLRGAYTFPYRNPAQSPRPDIPTFDFTFTVTEGDPVMPDPIEDQDPTPVANTEAPPSSGAWIIADMKAAPVGHPLTISAGGFEPDSEVELQWFRIVGNRVSGQGWDELAVPIGTVTTASEGEFDYDWSIPVDVGGPHRIEARVDGETVAETWVSVLVSAEPLDVSAGPWGTDFEVRLSGVGWTETANIYAIVYDNGYLGYACGFNTQGEVTIPLTMTGEPGWHFVDLYPAIYKGEEARGRNNFRIPQLTALDDHPGEELPIYRYAFFIEG